MMIRPRPDNEELGLIKLIPYYFARLTAGAPEAGVEKIRGRVVFSPRGCGVFQVFRTIRGWAEGPLGC